MDTNSGQSTYWTQQVTLEGLFNEVGRLYGPGPTTGAQLARPWFRWNSPYQGGRPNPKRQERQWGVNHSEIGAPARWTLNPIKRSSRHRVDLSTSMQVLYCLLRYCLLWPAWELSRFCPFVKRRLGGLRMWVFINYPWLWFPSNVGLFGVRNIIIGE